MARLVEALTARKVPVKWDHDLRAGENSAARLAEWLATAATVLVVWSKAAASSSNVVNEATRAQLNGTLVPVTIDGFGVIPEPFRSVQTIYLSDQGSDGYDAGFERLLEALSARTHSSGPPGASESSWSSPRPPVPLLPVRPAARELLRLALAIADAGGVRDAGPLDVLFACLLQDEYTELDRAELASGATASVVRLVRQPGDKRMATALRAVGVSRSKIKLSGRSIEDPRLGRIMTTANRLAREVDATELWSHHVLAAALTQPLSASVLDALRVNAGTLRTVLRIGIAEHRPNESRREWDSVLGSASSEGIISVQLDWVFTVASAGSQNTKGLAFLIDESTAITMSDVVPTSPPSVLLEALGTPARSLPAVRIEQTGLFAVLRLTESVEQVAAFRLESTLPAPNTPLEIIGVDYSGNPFLLSCVAGRTYEGDLIVYAEGAVSPTVRLVGSPVIAKERVVGMVKSFLYDQILVVPSAALARALGSQVPEEPGTDQAVPVEASEESQGPSRSFTTSFQALIAAARHVHGDRPGPVGSEEVLLGGLADASSGEVSPELTALWAAIPDVPARWDRVQAALEIVGSQATFPRPPVVADPTEDFITDPEKPAVTSLIARAIRLVQRLDGSGPIEARHLLAVALGGTGVISEEVETALGATSDALRQALRDAVRQSAPAELEAIWDELLRPAEPTLVGSFDSDLVAWDDTRQLTDHLEIENYVNMLSLVVASADTPMPLSIGLFGPWGSGKTYFMGLMRQAIKRLADQAEQDRAAGRTPASCARIVPITFNAWHYADANLWASLAVRIFDELAEREKKERSEREEKRQGLIGKLRIYRELEAELSAERKRARDQKKQLKDRLVTARERKDQAEGKLNGLKVRDVLAAAKDDPRLRQLWSRTSDELAELGIPAEFERLPETAAKLNVDVKNAVTLRAALKDRGRVRALTLTAPVLVVIGVVLLVAPGVLPAIGGTSIVAALVLAGRVLTWLQSRAADFRRVLNDVETTISVADDARSRAAARNQVEVERAEREVEKATAEIAHLEERRATAAAAALEVDRQLAELKAGARLQRFIAERSASSDYQRQLGVVSLARRDFEDLTIALRDAIDDYRAGGDAPVADRIVLYIDDLDRCSAERVVQVLEAVHLLLAMDLFVVVVGVDPRWLLRSLRQRFQGVFDRKSERDREDELWQWTPQNYLEKIFQIPFVLPSMSPSGYQALLQSLTASSQHEREPSWESHLPDEAIPAPRQPESSSTADPAALPFEEHSPAVVMTADLRPAAAATAAPLTPQLLDLTPSETALLGRLAPLVRTPRAAKRMLNIYRMLRVTRDLGPASRFLAGDYQSVCQLLALLTGYPRVFTRMVWGEPAANAEYRGLLDRPGSDRWSEFVASLTPRPSKKNWTNAVARSIPPSESDDWRAVVSALVSVRTSLAVADTLEPYQRWAPRIARFSFELSPFAGAESRAGR